MTEAQEKRRERNRRYYEKQKAKRAQGRAVIGDAALARSRMKRAHGVPNIFEPYKPPKSVAPAMAMDSSFSDTMAWALGGLTQQTGVTGFLGYPVLSELAQRPEYRRISEILAMEMTRKWVKLSHDGDDDKSEKIKAIETAMDRLHVRDVFREAVEQDGFFGRGHIYLDFGVTDDLEELRQSVGDGWNSVSQQKVPRNSFRRLKSVEAVWCYPNDYNSFDPLRPDWFHPTTWLVQGKEVHSTRLLTIIGREVPDLLKPAYSFGGLSLSQMAKPYVDNWLRTRQSVADLISSFSVFVLKTNLDEKLQVDPNGDQLFKRADFFNNIRDNRGLMITDKEMEDFANVSTSLATLDSLQAQTQEHMASVSGIPLVKLLGIQPAGLNASSEGELECFYTWINALQEKMLSEPLRTVLGFIQLSLFGEVDTSITFSWEPLGDVSELEAAQIRKTNAETGQVLISGKVISPEEERQRIASDDDSIYDNIDVEAAPGDRLTPIEKATIAAGITGAIVQAEGSGLVDTPIAMEELRKLSLATGVWTSITEADIVEAKLAPPPEPEMPPPAPGGGPGASPFGQDAEFNEADHPRDSDGKFSASGKGGAGSAYAELKPADVYFRLIDAEDVGGAGKVKEVARGISEERPDLADVVRQQARDLGYADIGVAAPIATPTAPRHQEEGLEDHNEPEPTPEKFKWVGTDQIEAANEILSAIHRSGMSDVGIRVIPPEYEGEVSVGAEIEPSYRWDNGDYTGERLDGVSTAAISSNDLGGVLNALNALGVLGRNGPNGYYFGGKIALIGGKSSYPGEDFGEAVIQSPEIIGVWTNDGGEAGRGTVVSQAREVGAQRPFDGGLIGKGV